MSSTPSGKVLARLWIDKDGNSRAVCSDAVDRMSLGERVVTRLSDVEFDNARQCWVAKMRDTGQELVGNNRAEVIEAELPLAEAIVKGAKYG